MEIPTALTFDDVLLRPMASSVLPRDADTRVTLTPRIALKVPLISSPMDTVTEAPLAIAMGRLGALGVIHKNLPPEVQAAAVRAVKEAGMIAAAALTSGEEARAAVLVEAGADLLVLDSAHGHSAGIAAMVEKLKKDYPAIPVMAGNVATAEGAKALVDAGADVVKVGIGPGSICTTRIVAGVGVPQLSAVLACAPVCRAAGVPLVADGGVRTSGDFAKAMAAGATAVMGGNMFAGTDEAVGDIIELEGRRYKQYRGMGSVAAMREGSAARYLQDQQQAPAKLVAEGVEALTPAKGPVEGVVHQMVGGLKAAMGYLGAKDIPAMWEQARFVRITGAGLHESHPHGVRVAAG